ncbi:aldose epimerase family protein [Streptomyces sp. H27-C3]|uniref:aldose epimerase family protein n=1 Tax=Streptomyces sp. H27-C3 TaxID=3046305 RepID=UPI0024BB9C43|nr:aldose epimerase family protein [Streptomyces sp. H27-C3]MDJ0462941.1 aldose epimerase family protein [Streptomyces sp. H27-C3]
MTADLFGTLDDGTAVHRWTLERGGTVVRVLTYGGIVQSVEAPDRDGRTAPVVVGFDSLAEYLDSPGPYLGALVGRYANWIAGGTFTLDGRPYTLARNQGGNALHGGDQGFDKRVWDARAVPAGVCLSRVSPDGEEGFPGRLEVSATYSLAADGALRIEYRAVTDAPTVLNPTNHTYWNLAGGAGVSQAPRIAAGRVTPVDESLIPTGELARVDGTRFDLRAPLDVGSGSGYDHNFVLDKGVTAAPEPVAELYDAVSGRVLTVATTEPGMQVYTPEALDGVALETQHFPDAPNRPEFPSTVLRPGEVFASTTVYGFGVRGSS